MDDIKIALLIDADNVSPRYISGILSELSKFGKITIRRMYGDWSQDRLHSWMRCASKFSLTPVMQPNNTPGKNASDIGLIIDAMDILYTGDAQGFCIVSSDGDFNKLATRLREAGKIVIGMGEKKTPETFRVSCERFIFLEVLGASDSDEDPAAGSAVFSAEALSAASQAGKVRAVRRKASAPAPRSKKSSAEGTDELYLAEGEVLFTDKDTIESAIIQMISDNAAEGKETGLGEIGSRLIKIFPDFDVRNYHFTKLSEYLKDFSSLNVENRDSAVWVSLNSSSDSEIERQILQIFADRNTNDLYINTLHKELQARNPNLEASIRKSSVTRFSVYLNRMIPSVEVNGRHVLLRE